MNVPHFHKKLMEQHGHQVEPHRPKRALAEQDEEFAFSSIKSGVAVV